MGDPGSLMLGYLLATLVHRGRAEDRRGRLARLPARRARPADPRHLVRHPEAAEVPPADLPGRPLALPPPLREHRLLAAAHGAHPLRLVHRRCLRSRWRSGSSRPPARVGLVGGGRAGRLGLVALVSSVYVIYTLEIIKLRRLGLWASRGSRGCCHKRRVDRPAPALSGIATSREMFVTYSALWHTTRARQPPSTRTRLTRQGNRQHRRATAGIYLLAALALFVGIGLGVGLAGRGTGRRRRDRRGCSVSRPASTWCTGASATYRPRPRRSQPTTSTPSWRAGRAGLPPGRPAARGLVLGDGALGREPLPAVGDRAPRRPDGGAPRGRASSAQACCFARGSGCSCSS